MITDLVMPRMDGLALLRALQAQGADVTTLLLTAQGTVETAVEAMKEGAYDYLTKPIDIQRLKILLDKIVERLETMREVKALRRQLREHGTFGPLIGNSPEMRKIYQVVEQAAPTGRRCSSPASRAPARSWSRRRCTSSVRARRFRSSRSTAPRFPKRCSRARFSVTRRAPSPAPRIGGRAASSSRIAARCSSTRSAR